VGTAHAQADVDDYAKDVAAPPSDIVSGRVVLPVPEALGVESGVQVRALEPRWTPDKGWVAESDVAVDAEGAVAVALLTPDAVDWTWEITAPDGSRSGLESWRARGLAARDRRDDIADFRGWSGDRWDLARLGVGTWRVHVRAAGLTNASTPNAGWLLVRTAGPARIRAYASTLATRSDVPIGIVARFEDAGAIARVHGTARVELATGVVSLDMFDDGAHQDGSAGDGAFGASLPRWASGAVRARVELVGTTPDGAPIARSAQLAFPVVERRAALTGEVTARVEPDERVRIDLEALPLGPRETLHVSSELWGTRTDGTLVPVCWLSRMQTPDLRGDSLALSLWLDARWIELAHASAPFVLRRVRVQDPGTHIPHDLVDELAFEMPALPALRDPAPDAPTLAMLQGPVVGAVRSGPRAPIAPVMPNPALLLVHGYCSGGSIWPASDFTQPKLEFLDPDANRTHDQFALLLRSATSALTSFGVVAHSQGGMAALHLYTYYASGLDTASGPRLIQSVCSPYLGTPLASLGSFACGVNNDMTPSGGPLWLTGIPTWARSRVYFWTTQNSGSACNFLTGLLLTDPEDGTVEMFSGQLVGANSMGHVTGWCHTTGMSDPASYTDHARNGERDAQAAR
jgi:hypothetical protein